MKQVWPLMLEKRSNSLWCPPPEGPVVAVMVRPKAVHSGVPAGPEVEPTPIAPPAEPPPLALPAPLPAPDTGAPDVAAGPGAPIAVAEQPLAAIMIPATARLAAANARPRLAPRPTTSLRPPAQLPGETAMPFESPTACWRIYGLLHLRPSRAASHG